MSHPEPLQVDQYYHIYNRGVNGVTLFHEQRNYPYFLKLYIQHIEPIAEPFAYSLLATTFTCSCA